MPGRIECYFDIASFYSYVAFLQILRNKELLEQNSIEIEIHPVLLGAINAGSGNKPPWSLPAKAVYGRQDMQRAAKSVGLVDAAPPGDLMEASRTMLPLRALLYIQANYPRPVYLTTLHYLFHVFWTLHRAPNDADTLLAVLLEVPADFSPSPSPPTPTPTPPSPSTPTPTPLFHPPAASRIIREATSSRALKDALRLNVERALARGAFGAPWLWVTRSSSSSSSSSSKVSKREAKGANGGGNGSGNENGGENGNGDEEGAPFFGSDRWHFVYEYLGVPYRGVELLAPEGASGLGSGAGAEAGAKL
ncbi:thioredoxin-like protein [Biscogniauxia sp. FL1348]|nr:thioredoxin-like protein [Biscogniauxia sp. FL1348]